MSKVHPKMSIADRAKQFMSFDALKGFDMELASMERIPVERPVIADDRAEELDRTIKSIISGTIITVIYYDAGEYIKRTGVVSGIDTDKKCLYIVNKKISFSDIYEIDV